MSESYYSQNKNYGWVVMDPIGKINVYDANGGQTPLAAGELSSKDLEGFVSAYIESFKSMEEIKITEKFLCDFAEQVSRQIKNETSFIKEECLGKVTGFSTEFRDQSIKLEDRMGRIEKHLDAIDTKLNEMTEKLRHIDRKVNNFILNKRNRK